jgi:Ca2+-binding RTX toxin-like protein
VTAPDYETNPHSYQVQLSAFDGVNASSELITVNLANVPGVTITGTAHNDIIDATTIVPGQSFPTNEEDEIYGGAGNDTINALGGNDYIDGGHGADTMIGGLGDDIYVVDNIKDVVIESQNGGIDAVRSSISYTLGPNVENITLTGSSNINGTGNAVDNIIIGNSGNNTLSGLAGADTINGGAGNDAIIGGSGADILKGELGNDKFVFTNLADSLPNTPDTITDFMHGADIIDLSAIDANTSSKGNQIFFFGGQNPDAVAHSVTWHEAGGNTVVQADVSGDATADLTIVLTGIHLHLTPTDFIL